MRSGGRAGSWKIVPVLVLRRAQLPAACAHDQAIKLTETREITPCVWVHPDDER
jgi:hypothetical protein